MDAVFALRAEGKPELEASNGRNATEVPAPLPSPERVRSGAVKAMGASLERLASQARAAEDIATGTAVAELDPGLIDGSFVADRVSDVTDPTFEALIESIRDSGQQVPILVRPHPRETDRYQIAYGHRRVRAVAALGRRVRAIVQDLTDAQLVVAQGKENLERRDLSYIERAFFARRLEEMSFPRDVICAAMGVHRPDVSNFITVARRVPPDLVAAIGPAPKAGGPRWRKLADLLSKTGRKRIDALLRKPEFQAKQTDERFQAVLETISPTRDEPSGAQIWSDDEGRRLVRFQRVGSHFTLSIDEKLEPELGEFLIGQLPDILAAYRASKE